MGTSRAALFTDGDFETGTAGSPPPAPWVVTTYINPILSVDNPTTFAQLNLTTGGTAQTRVVDAAGAGPESQVDPALGATAAFRWPKYGQKALYVNGYTGTGRNANSVKQSMVVGVNDVDPYDGKIHVRFAVAPVLQNPGHTPREQPYFFIQLRNTSNSTTLFTDFNFSNQPGVPWKTLGQIVYTDWALVDVAPTTVQAALGDTLELEVIAAGCSQSGHYGRVYLDGVTAKIPGLAVAATAPASANQNADYEYDVAFNNGGTGTAGNVAVDFNIPTGTTFRDVTAPGAVCSSPNVGTTGKVSCTYGLLDPGQSNRLKIKVRVDSGATGTITAGNYQISANNVTPLIGTKVFTSVTSGVSYTDLNATITNNVGAVGWGQALTYKIVATNPTAAAVTGATVTYTPPAELTNVSWTCAGVGGGTCTASGTGAINNTVNLPAGGSVVYTVSATMAASGAATKVVSLANIAPPAGMTDSRPADNADADTDLIVTTQTLTVAKGGTGTGRVVTIPGAIDCTTGCSGASATFQSGAVVRLAASADNGSIFAGWSGGGCTGTGDCQVTLAAATTVTATFNPEPPCSQDSDCSGFRYCDGSTNKCAPRLPNGSVIPNDGIHNGVCTGSVSTTCVSGVCNTTTNTCAGNIGDTCSTTTQCASNACNATTGKCAKSIGAACTTAAECGSNTCTGNVCVCTVDAHCGTTNYCSAGACVPRLSNGSSCTAGTQCTSNICAADSKCGCSADSNCTVNQFCDTGTRSCTAKQADGANCTAASQCTSAICGADGKCGCSADANCAANQYCNTASRACVAKQADGASCTAASQCTSGICGADSQCGCSVDGNCAVGQYCNTSTRACTAKVANGAGCSSSNQCTSGLCGSDNLCGCSIDANCQAGEYCASGSRSCTVKVVDGGSCTAANQCSSGLCGSDGKCGCAADNNCGAGQYCSTARACTAQVINGGSCTGANQCSSGLCGSDNKCGCGADLDCGGGFCAYATRACSAKLAAGAGIPSDGLHGGSCSDAPAVCSSGLCNSVTSTCATGSGTTCSAGGECTSNACSASGRCVASSNGCYVDGECGAGEYCNRAALTCALRLGKGTPIPNDGLHTGTCADSSAVCATGLTCNSIAAQDSCAVSDGDTCTTAADCVSNTCSASGRCVPASSGCYADSDCSSGNYCNRATLTCSPTLPAGTAIPNDGLHGGSCTDAAAVCSSGLCNSVTSTCATGAGTTCGAGSGCTTNVCSASGRCVPSSSGCYVDGECAAGEYCNRTTLLCVPRLSKGAPIPNDGLHTGTCTDAAAVCAAGLTCNSIAAQDSCAVANGETCTTAADCVSNTCSASGRCVPASSGCYVDSDCAGGTYCNRASLTCSPKLPAGTAIPNDGLHGGSCTAAAAVCSSGLCNSVTSTCATGSGTTCGAANECTTNACSASGRCVASSNGCYVDGECSSSEYCNRAALACSPRLSKGSPIPTDGLHTGTCADSSAVCATGLTCNSIAAQDSCAVSDGDTCASAADCASNACSSSGRCVPAGGGCYVDGDCSTTEYCNRASLTCASKLAAGAAVPNDGLHGGTCSDAAAVCLTGLCNSATNSCASADRTTCGGANECVSNTCTSGHCVPSSNGCWADADCGSSEFCDRANLACKAKLAPGVAMPTDGLHTGCNTNDGAAVCTTGKCNGSTVTCAQDSGAPCAAAAECVNNTCGTNGKCGVADGGSGCNSGNAAALCQSGTCSASGRCVPAVDGCHVDSDCGAGRYCLRSSLTCAALLASGQAIPNDGLHDGKCTLANAQATCASGKCNATTNTCASPNTVACATASECVNNLCGSNGKCGAADGDGPCSQSNALTVCQSGLCSATSALCVPSLGKTCAVDSDCAAAEYCDGASKSCVADLANGVGIPNDGLHSGVCTQPTGAAVCSSGVCSTGSNVCVAPTGATCTAGAQCLSGVCGANGKCGLPSGAGPCTQASAALDCQSGRCGVAGVCLELSGCSADADCSASTYCDGGTSACVARLAAGTPLPNDGKHDGQCPSTGLSPVCLSGYCSTGADTCALPNPAACTSSAECVSGVCGANGRCGAPDGAPCAVAADCQSASCDAGTGTCVGGANCGADADCGAGLYCTGTKCAAKLPNGAALPSDGLHDATCSSASATAVCLSGECNSANNTCAAAANAPCAAATQCASNVCAANGNCGIPDGAGPCTSGTAAQCQSGNCAASGKCVAIGGCAADSDCSASEFCDGASSTCKVKLPNGTKLPKDGIHDGVCSLATAVVCASGVCNAAAQTCAGTNGTGCTANGECVVNICGADGQCGLPNGGGLCDPASPAPCRSGACSATARTCIPSGGCANDNDCAASAFCDAGLTCQPRVADGQPVPGGCAADGVARECSSGRCNVVSNTCAQPTGGPCAAANECSTNVCGANGKCGADTGSPCAAAAECQSGVCDTGTCTTGGSCSQDSDCAADSFCDGAQCRTKLGAGAKLPTDAVHDGVCSPTLALAVCASGACNSVTDTCAGSNGSASCADAKDCASNVCGSDGSCGLPTGEGICTADNAVDICRSGRCSVVGVCLPPSTSGCAIDGDCPSDSFCLRSGFICQKKLSAGTAIPNDGLHDGSCTSANATAVCANGACNATTNTCAKANGTGCTVAAECTVNVCGQNGQCGIAEGDGPCTVLEQANCQSGACSSNAGKCIALGGGCAVDGDCSDSQFCDATARRCVNELPSGAALPRDSLHDGNCGDALAKAVCADELCNALTNTCAAANGGTCASASNCVNSLCGSNGKCGLAEGDAGCTVENQAKECQSGACSKSGVCMPVKGCAADADCGSGQFCDGVAKKCKVLLATGEPLPKDGIHDGVCSDAQAKAVCLSGLCNVAAKTCASTTGTVCSETTECVTNVCADGKCGRTNGTGPCSKNADCQSSKCDVAAKVCIPATNGCAVDGDCAAGSFCSPATFTCTQKVDTGKLPNGEKCTTATGAKYCASGLCNDTTNTCGVKGGEACGAAADCAANACTDGKCGSTGGGACSDSNAASVCQSGECSAGKCVGAVNGCKSDTDCAVGSCDRDTLSCSKPATNGTKFPETGRYTSCSAEAAAAVCESKACNATTNTCAAADGQACTANDGCASNDCREGLCIPAGALPPGVMPSQVGTKLDGGGCAVGGDPSSIAAVLFGLVFFVRRRRAA